MKITVIDLTGKGLPPADVYLEGKLSREELRAKAFKALGLGDFLGVYRIEVKNGAGEFTTKITSDCTIFVVSGGKPAGPYDDIFSGGGIFGDIFGKN